MAVKTLPYVRTLICSGTKHFAKERGAGVHGKAPVIRAHKIGIHLDNAGHRHQQNAARAQDTTRMCHGRLRMINVLKRLRQNNTIKSIRRNAIGRGEISHNRRVRISRINIQHIRVLDARCQSVVCNRCF